MVGARHRHAPRYLPRDRKESASFFSHTPSRRAHRGPSPRQPGSLRARGYSSHLGNAPAELARVQKRAVVVALGDVHATEREDLRTARWKHAARKDGAVVNFLQGATVSDRQGGACLLCTAWGPRAWGDVTDA